MLVGVNGVSTWEENREIILDVCLILRCHQYLTVFFTNRALPEEQRLQEVYMDESYIHEHYHCNDDSIWDPSDEQDIQQSKE